MRWPCGVRAWNSSTRASTRFPPELCKELTRGGDVRTIVDGIRAARAAGFPQIRINTVLMRTYNGDSLPSLVRFAAELGCEIRFIELMPFGEGAAIYDREFLSADEALQSLEAEFHESRPPAAAVRRHGGIGYRSTVASRRSASSPTFRIPFATAATERGSTAAAGSTPVCGPCMASICSRPTGPGGSTWCAR